MKAKLSTLTKQPKVNLCAVTMKTIIRAITIRTWPFIQSAGGARLASDSRRWIPNKLMRGCRVGLAQWNINRRPRQTRGSQHLPALRWTQEPCLVHRKAGLFRLEILSNCSVECANRIRQPTVFSGNRTAQFYFVKNSTKSFHYQNTKSPGSALFTLLFTNKTFPTFSIPNSIWLQIWYEILEPISFVALLPNSIFGSNEISIPC